MTESRKRILLYVLGSIILGFLTLSVLVYMTPINMLDQQFSEKIQEHQHPHLDTIMKVISWPGYPPQSVVIVLCTAFIALLFKLKRESLFIALTLLSGVVSRFVKILMDRPRPTEDLVRIIDVAKHQSFPSGHVLFYVVFLGFMIVMMNYRKDINRTIRLIVIAISTSLIFTVPISRVYLGAHWFTDVLAGGMLGILVLFMLSYFYFKKKKISYGPAGQGR